MPTTLDQGQVYISIRYRTAAHLCACGCGAKIVTPIKPPKWHLTFDGETATLWPSIGNWHLPCRSHYWIRRNQIIWAKPWTQEKIEAARNRDAADLRKYYTERIPGKLASAKPKPTATVHPLRQLWRRWTHSS